MNRIILLNRSILYFLLLFSTLGCEKVFHENKTYIAEIESYDELVLAVNGVYGRFEQTAGSNAANLKGDDLSSDYVDYRTYYGYNCRIIYPNSFLYQYETVYQWEQLFKVIASANNIIIQYPISSVQDQSIREIVGEVYLIRAFCYFRLTRTYGQVPLVDDIDVNYSLPKSSFNEIYTFIENDLKMAGRLLPVNNSTARIPYVTPHRGVVKAILAELYLSWAGYPANEKSKYAMAAREAGEVIDSSDFFGLGLLDDFSYLWDREHYYNSESLLSLYFEIPGNDTFFINQGSYYYYYDKHNLNSIYEGYASSSEYGSSVEVKTDSGSISFRPYFYSTEMDFFNNFPPGYRKEITFFQTLYIPGDNYDNTAIDTGYIHIETVDICPRIGYRKFYYMPYIVPEAFKADGFPTSIFGYQIFGCPRVYLFRYAHTLLTYAEASARAGNPDAKAYECVNQIRRRAHQAALHSPSIYDLQPGLSPEAFADSIVWERAWELCGEPEGRWVDLIRLEQVENLPDMRNPRENGPPGGSPGKNDYFFPIPDFDQNLNPNLQD